MAASGRPLRGPSARAGVGRVLEDAATALKPLSSGRTSVLPSKSAGRPPASPIRRRSTSSDQPAQQRHQVHARERPGSPRGRRSRRPLRVYVGLASAWRPRTGVRIPGGHRTPKAKGGQGLRRGLTCQARARRARPPLEIDGEREKAPASPSSCRATPPRRRALHFVDVLAPPRSGIER